MTERSRTSALAVGAAIAAGLLLSACDRQVVTSSISEDYRQRHPIVLARANETLDVFTGRNGGRLDRRQSEDVRAFAQLYMEHGEGPLVAYLPTGGGHNVNAGLSAIRSTLAGGGASGRLQIAHYQAEAGDVSPIKLAFARLKAKTLENCGYDDHDITPTSWRQSNLNAPPRNLGCAYQRNLAAQIADPRDLVRPRQEGPVDVERRTSAIERIRDNSAQELKPGGKSLKTLVAE
jgi:pilus assembly protein CpaD